ncbi:YrrS family protein [Aquibacillus sp. 3ASR75-11]|uniref:YrrS family protein n=1 Tax=Terrihalobacillus insolitus TaxID=2950438 RepID=A0A9X4AM43_9BACI|nr:YrrS family protein [Terrihalobacillus insolitus]MDC3413303.1 YrrS family protein [Terrihalobacillus insolitus]MDC3424886.1 YrrS family protein [Terrihalobacillus insolitus]
MSEEYDTYSRVDRFDKRRKNTKMISVFIVLGSLLIVLLVGLLIFGGGKDEQDQAATSKTEETENDAVDELDGETGQMDEPEDTNENTGTDEDTVNDDQESVPNIESDTEELDNPQDDNVIRAYTGDWEPVGTPKEGPYQFPQQDSQDWQEMIDAVSLATGLSKDNMIQWWVTNNGEQSIVATVTNNEQTENYRAYVTWIENEGWKPTKVEVLKENDQKDRFSQDEDTNDGESEDN